MQEETNGMSLSKIFKTIWRQKWITLIVAVLVTLFGAITLFYGYNPSQENYVMEFSLNLPGDSNSVVYIYPNGTQFYYSDLTSLKTLKTIKGTDPAFEKIDVEKMANNGHINIKRDVTSVVDNNEAVTAYREISYTISVKASYFENESRAKDFLIRLANTPADYLSSMKIEYGVYLDMVDMTQDYEDEITLLKSQLSDIQKKYATLISTYGDSFVVKDGKTLLAYSQEVKAYSDSKILDNLLTEAQSNFYIKDVNYKDNYRLQLIELEKELAKAQTTLKTLTDMKSSDPNSTTVVLDASVIKAQQDLVTDLTNKKEVINNYIENGEENADYKAAVKSAYDKVDALTQDYSFASAAVYGKASSVVYLNPGIVAAEGGMGLMKITLISLIAGIVIALIAGYVAGYLTLRKEKARIDASSTTPTNTTSAEQTSTENVTSTDENK